MGFEDTIKRLNRILTLVALNSTGTKEELAKKIEAGTSTIERDIKRLNVIAEMGLNKNFGRKVIYNKKLGCYIFEDE